MARSLHVPQGFARHLLFLPDRQPPKAAMQYCRFVTVVTEMPEVLGFWRMAGEYDYLMRVQVADMKRYDEFYKRLVNSVPGLSDVTSSFAMEQIKYTTSLPIE